VLDLFGGTGAVGIESLSRGATFAQFIDLERKAVETIQKNLENCRLSALAKVNKGDSFAYLEKYSGEAFDLIYIAPPQYRGMWLKALKLVDGRPELLAQYGAVVVQIHPREEEPVDLHHLEEYDRRKYGSVRIIFYAAKADLDEEE